MKKYIILGLVVIMAVTAIGYLYLNSKSAANTVSANNKTFEQLLNKTITGTEFATYMNQILDRNSKNSVEKDSNGYYINNNENSIIAEIKFKDSDNIFRIEQISNNGIGKFINLYAKLNQEYYGPDVTLDELTGWSCYYVPHFYYDYYVYKYTLGMTVALAIVKRILNGDQKQVDDYLNFLRSGGSKAPVDLLKTAGVDPLDDQIYEDAFAYFESLLNQFETLKKA